MVIIFITIINKYYYLDKNVIYENKFHKGCNKQQSESKLKTLSGMAINVKKLSQQKSEILNIKCKKQNEYWMQIEKVII